VEIPGVLEEVLQQERGTERAQHRGLRLKDIHTKDKHKFSSPWEGPFIIVDIAAPGAYVLAEVDDGMLPNIWNADQSCKYYV
jgi:hypothetical protein